MTDRHRAPAQAALGCISGLIFLAQGVLQMAGIGAGLHVWLRWPWALCVIAGIAVGILPFVGTALGMVGAHYAWGWSWPKSAGTFWAAYALYLLLGLCVGPGQALRRRLAGKRADP